jgi:mannose-1-phosphate guanylyltransferase
MRAILLAAGFGTRLQPLTLDIPKCLVPIKGRPLLELWLEKLFDAGIESLLVNTHYLSDQVERVIASSKFKNKVEIVYEPILLGTAGTLLENLNFYKNQDGLLLHADNYFEGDLRSFIAAHKNRPPSTLMTMMTFHTDEPESCGIVEVDTQNIVRAFHEKKENPPGNLANGALYMVSDRLIQILKRDHQAATDFSTEIIPNLIDKIFNFTTLERYIDIGTIKNYSKVK